MKMIAALVLYLFSISDAFSVPLEYAFEAQIESVVQVNRTTDTSTPINSYQLSSYGIDIAVGDSYSGGFWFDGDTHVATDMHVSINDFGLNPFDFTAGRAYDIFLEDDGNVSRAFIQGRTTGFDGTVFTGRWVTDILDGGLEDFSRLDVKDARHGFTFFISPAEDEYIFIFGSPLSGTLREVTGDAAAVPIPASVFLIGIAGFMMLIMNRRDRPRI